jgi:hypothetical protein
MIVPTLIMILAKWYDPNHSLIISKDPDMRSDLYDVATAFRTAFYWSEPSCPALPVPKPGLLPDSAFTLPFGCPDDVVDISMWHTVFFLLYENLKKQDCKQCSAIKPVACFV